MKYLYYPGCSLRSTGCSYEESFLAVFNHLEIPLEELNDWNCCGATAYMSIDELKAFALAARNLALAEIQGEGTEERPANLIAPCAACYLVLKKTDTYIKEFDEIGQIITKSLKDGGLKYNGNVNIRHPLDILANDYGSEKLTQWVTDSMRGLKVACYYGCQILRPYADFDDQFDPMTMDNLATAVGAQAVKWPFKTRCCGGDLILTSCALCQINLECFQKPISKKFNEDMEIPIIYFTQLIGLALGLSPKSLGLNRSFVPVSIEKYLTKRRDHVSV
jgi:heterodisulfide reductase subunit B